MSDIFDVILYLLILITSLLIFFGMLSYLVYLIISII